MNISLFVHSLMWMMILLWAFSVTLVWLANMATLIPQYQVYRWMHIGALLSLIGLLTL